MPELSFDFTEQEFRDIALKGIPDEMGDEILTDIDEAARMWVEAPKAGCCWMTVRNSSCRATKAAAGTVMAQLGRALIAAGWLPKEEA